ncbi:MAG: carbamoyltransferase HypF, partial [Methylocystaceae bacterium]
NACPVCGPKMTLLDNHGTTVDMQPADLLKMGYVLAVKGLGGFHLAVDAGNHEAVSRLRQRKHREAKPFAVMARDLAAVNKYCQVNEAEARWLTSPQAPIVILTSYDDDRLPGREIHPGINTLGVMLPYTPLHFQLFADDLDLLIMTSANISDQPLIIENHDAITELAGVADYFLVHNRDIHNPCDDSVIRITPEQTIQSYRRARGYVPRPITLPFQLKPVLATGGDMKNTFCLTRYKFAFLSQHGGDLSHYLNYVRFQEAIPRFLKIVNTEPQIIAHDLHPDYQTSKWAKEQDLPRLEVQHHHAHMAAAMAENHIEGDVIALICDGTGYGTDGAVWGCEILSGSYRSFVRQGHLRYVPLPGGDTSINRPYRMALVYLWQALGMQGVEKADQWLPDLTIEEREVLLKQITRGINTLPTSSCGRLFDAVSALLGVCSISQYEGQAAVELEAMLSQQTVTGYSYQLEQENGMIIMNVLPMWRDIIDDLTGGCPKSEISGKFHAGLVNMFVDGIGKAAENAGLDRIILSGGTFYNQSLLTNLKSRLQQAGMQVFYPQHIPTGDGGLSLGQAVIASEVNN